MSTKPKNQFLIDDVVLEILKHLNLNDKSNLRLVSRQFRDLAYVNPIRKLIIYEKQPRLSGNLKMTDEQFTLEDTVEVYDLNKFFGSKPLIQILQESLLKLVIYGLDASLVTLNEPFKKLNYLELKDLNFTDATILKSPKLKKLHVYRTSFTTPDRFESSLQNGNSISSVIFNKTSGLRQLKGKLKHYVNHLSFLDSEIEFFKLCVKSKVFSELEILDIKLYNLNNLVYLSKELPSLKQIHLFSGPTFYEFRDYLCDRPLEKIVKKLRKDLTVYLFGVPLSIEKIKIITDFFLEVGSDTKLNVPIEMNKNAFTMCGTVLLPDSRLSVETGSEWYKQKETLDENRDLFDGFVNLVDTICFKNEFFGKDDEKRFYQRFKNAHTITYTFWLDVQFDLPATFEMFSEVRDLKLVSFPDAEPDAYDSRILEKIPVCNKLIYLLVEFWDPNGNFDFLLQLNPQIKSVKLFLRYQINDDLYLEFIRKYGNQYLSYVEIYFQKLDKTKEELSIFKKKVLKLIDDMKIKNCSFKIEIHRHEGIEICRMVFRRNGLCRDGVDSWTTAMSEFSRINYCINFKHKNKKIRNYRKRKN